LSRWGSFDGYCQGGVRLTDTVVLIPPIYIIKILDIAIPNQKIYEIGIYIFIVLLFTIIESFLKVKLAWLYSILSKKVYVLFQKKCINHIFKLSGNYYTDLSIGNNFTTITNDVSQLKTLVSSTFFDFIYDVIVAIVMFIFLADLQLDLSLIILCILPIIYFSQSYFQKKGRKKAEAVRDAYGKFASVLQNIVSNTLACIFSNSQKYMFQKYSENVDKTTDKEVETQMIFAKNGAVLNLLSTLFTIIILGFGGMKVITGALTIGGLIAFNMYSQKLVVPLLKISNVLMELQSTIVSMERVNCFLQEPEIKEKNVISNGINKNNNTILFQNVSFSYKNNYKVLKDISFEFRPNIINAIVGESGCGKSTLVSILYRLWDVQNGEIIINNNNIKDFGIKYLRENITILSQEVFLFDDTILNNIVLDTKSDIAFVHECAKIACIHDYIMSLPDGYETIVGEKGIKLSGGERQRICIVRALIRNTPIIIFDESTSALDQLTEKLLIENIKKQKNGKVVIIITHRLQSIIEAESIFVMKDGEIKANGKHDELMNNCAYYNKMYERNILTN